MKYATNTNQSIKKQIILKKKETNTLEPEINQGQHGGLLQVLTHTTQYPLHCQILNHYTKFNMEIPK